MPHPAARFFCHVVTRCARNAALGAKGEPGYTLANQTTIRARVERQTKTVRGSDGQELVASHVMWCFEDVQETDAFWLPSIDGTTADDVTSLQKSRSPIAVSRVTTRRGDQSLTEVRFA